MSVSLLVYTNLQNPILGLMMGVVATAIIQSSSATTSLVVALVASGSITLAEGIPVVMGTNVGTSLTSTMVALSSIKKVEEYELGFSVAVVHDIFNWLTIFFMLPLEIGTGFLETVSGKIATWTESRQNISLTSDFSVEVLFKPVISSVIVLRDESVFNSLRLKNTDTSEEVECIYPDSSEELESEGSEEDLVSALSILEDDCEGTCTYLFAGSSLSDETIGTILLVASFIILMLCYLPRLGTSWDYY